MPNAHIHIDKDCDSASIHLKDAEDGVKFTAVTPCLVTFGKTSAGAFVFGLPSISFGGPNGDVTLPVVHRANCTFTPSGCPHARDRQNVYDITIESFRPEHPKNY